ncbi:hypothetical protein DL89DRAFT_291844 [Linderina pennispora]|uniref:50S ribosomal protein L9, chloroplastic n=1 Tax=Linderina pennispora TaxID=61395 RepID=A0A1Y1WCR6_9FUNG|nr:uncharacterized protein DL89DRAFT_291844 [Linderina pennispora]KAJ1937919.1 hypothetical protein EC988_007744 [Linderina pennispora]ORX71321.1 hypothetical protein DL89DRAFT_291844 [Linderina pennispora]
MNFLGRQVSSSGLARSPIQILQRGLKKKTTIPVKLIKDVPRIGAVGTVIEVDPAYMRHELFPKRLADYVIARRGPLDRSKVLAEEKAAEGPSRAALDQQQKVHATALGNQTMIQRVVELPVIEFERSAVEGSEENEAIYGSVSKADVLKALGEHGIKIEKEALAMDDKIKTLGEYTCVVKLIYAGQASFTIRVVKAEKADN